MPKLINVVRKFSSLSDIEIKLATIYVFVKFLYRQIVTLYVQ